MNQRRTIVLMFSIGAVGILAGCNEPWRRRGSTLTDEQTALVELGNSFDYWQWTSGTNWDSGFFPPKALRSAPGTIELEVGWPRQDVVFTVEAGRTYTLRSRLVGKRDEAWIEDEHHPEGRRRLLPGEIQFVWVEDETGSVVFGKRPSRE